MTHKSSSETPQGSLADQVTAPADKPFMDAARALLRVGYLFGNDPGRPYHAHGLTLAQLDVLSALARADDATLNCSEIAKRTLITKGGITGILDRLEARGLVKRVPSREDRRSTRVRLSAKGIEFFRKLYPEVARSNRQIFETAFRPDQMKQFRELIALLIECLETE